MKQVFAVTYTNFRTIATDDGTFGKHEPGSLENRLMVEFEPLDD